MLDTDHPAPDMPIRRIPLVALILFYLLLMVAGMLAAIDTDLIESLGITQQWWERLPLTPVGTWLIWVILLASTIWALVILLKRIGRYSLSLALIIMISAYLVTPVSTFTSWWVNVSTIVCPCELDERKPTIEERMAQPDAWYPGLAPILVWIPGSIALWRVKRKCLRSSDAI